MSRRKHHDVAAMPISHETARQWVLPYFYRRLSTEQEAALEAHVRTCAHCQAEDLGHLATERMHAMRQRPSTRQPLATPLTISLSILLVLLLVFAGLLVYSAGRNGALRALLGHASMHNGANLNVTVTTTPSPLPSPTPTVLTAAGTVGPASGAVTLAMAPDGVTLALATNPGSGQNGGVVLYKNNKPITRLVGFEGYKAPGTMLWSANGSELAAAGAMTLFVWKVSTGVATTVRLKSNPGTDLYVYDWANNKLVTSVPASIFATSGFAQWGDRGQVTAATTGSAAPGNIPPANSPIFALWSGQQGVRIFRDSSGITEIGYDDSDIASHTALLRWSPDGRYLLWGYPRLPISASLLATASDSTATPSATTALGAPDPAIATLVNHIGQAASTTSSALIWPSPDGLQIMVIDTSVAHPGYVIVDAQTDAILADLPDATTTATNNLLSAVTWIPNNPTRLVIAPAGQATLYHIGP